MNPLLPREGTKSSTVATCTRTNSCTKWPGGRRAGSGLLSKGHSRCFAISIGTGVLSAPHAPGKDGDNNSQSAENGQEECSPRHQQQGCSCFILLLAADYEC